MIVGNKRIPFADLPVSHGQNVLNSTPSRLRKNEVNFTKTSEIKANERLPKSIPFALHMMTINYYRKSMERLQLANTFLQWRLRSAQAKSTHKRSSHDNGSTSVARDQTEVPKWATPKKRRIDSVETAGIENLHSAYKHYSTPAPATARHSPAKPPKTPITESSSSQPVEKAELKEKEKEKEKEKGRSPLERVQSKGSLFARLALLEEEIQHVKLSSQHTHIEEQSSSKGSVFEHVKESKEQGNASSSLPPPSSSSASSSSQAKEESKPNLHVNDENNEGSREEWRKGFHFWMLKKMYTQHTSLESRAWLDINSQEGVGSSSQRREKKDLFVNNIATSLAPLGDQGKGIESPVPLSSLPHLQTKMSSWKHKYTQR